MFDIDFRKLVLWLIPTFLRKRRLYAFISVLVSPVVRLYDMFMTRRQETIYRIEHTSQVYSIENVLNDRFDKILRRIFISDANYKPRLYLFLRQELKPLFLGKSYLYNKTDYADTGCDFIVWIPYAVYISDEDMYELKAQINYYKLAGKRYSIYRI